MAELDSKGTAAGMGNQKEQKAEKFGFHITGIFLGAGKREFNTQNGVKSVSALSLALPGLAGAIEIGVDDDVLKVLETGYTLGQVISVEVDRPRAYNGRVYYDCLCVE